MDQMDQQKRLLLTIVLTTVVMGVWFTLTAGPGPEGPESRTAVADAGRPVAPDAGASLPLFGEAPERTADLPEELVRFSTPAQELVFTNRGAGLVKAVVRNAEHWPMDKFRSREKDERGESLPVDLARLRPGQAPPGAVEISGELSVPLSATFAVERGTDEVVFTYGGEQVGLRKRFRIARNGYELREEVQVTNRTASTRKVRLSVVYPAYVDPATQKGGGFFSPQTELSEAICRHGSSTERQRVSDEAEEKGFPGEVRFAGLDERYFMGVIFPRFAGKGGCTLRTEANGHIVARIDEDLGEVAPGQTVTREFGLYVGPKELDELRRVSASNAAGGALTAVGQEPVGPKVEGGVDPDLTRAIDFGWWAVICRVLLAVMKFFQGLVVNWGLAIILMTLVVKALLYPLSHKQMESMEAMRRLQPQMEALQKKYAEDKEKMNLERMKLFQENKVNPFGGCLPLLIQMPVWIALYQTLLASFELYREPLIGFWVQDLTLKDPFYVLPLVMGVTMFITQKMQPQMGDPTQAKVMLYFMPVFFTFIMLSLPAGLTLYIFTNNLLSIAQQKYLQRKFAKAAAATAGTG